ncbi:uncharacterized protein L969DRAFT_87645 [Mixia osmundae IAM 14324]|uniref:LNR domain-containing protein n=1 Tax=Mixia osmundae (strain CBS 9802 / IAM 14324 / JCM 22182 / KY 12970) TaxID=764103 RepID=G7DVN9_MIXOS|nr:uncharacterized protein L969DRAFT_87645 [Mixia osmundae IAM 14324]KEI39669.1 hypothetical protein L969DRAFT_87645 [Mixia osmundae IAM 14324]GAA94649.1 hypothetical protein E5Q_01302 [Mixia osmundae IAM 14324]
MFTKSTVLALLGLVSVSLAVAIAQEDGPSFDEGSSCGYTDRMPCAMNGCSWDGEQCGPAMDVNLPAYSGLIGGIARK